MFISCWKCKGAGANMRFGENLELIKEECEVCNRTGRLYAIVPQNYIDMVEKLSKGVGKK